MNRNLRRLDLASITLLLLWLGMALGFGTLMAPALFANLPSRDLAGRIAGVMVAGLDVAAWIAFGGALLLSVGGRWLKEIEEPGPVGPVKLWTAAALAALLFTFASSFVATPKLRELRGQMKVAVDLLPEDDALLQAYRKAHKFSTQFFVIRMVLAAALALGATKLPEGPPEPEEKTSE